MEETVTLAESTSIPGTLESNGQYWEININPSESAAERVDIEQWLPALLSQKPLYSAAITTSAALPGSSGKETELWSWLLMIALLCLF